MSDPTQGQNPAEQNNPDEIGVEAVEGFTDPFEEDWDDGEMRERHKEWRRLLSDIGENEINAGNPDAMPPGPPGDNTGINRE